MPAVVAQLAVKVGGDTSEAKSKLTELSGHVNTVGEHFKSALGSVLGFASGAAVIGGVTMAAGFLVGQMKDVVAAGISQQKVMTETDTVLKSMGNSSGQTAQSIGDYADSMAKATGISDDLIQHSENVLLTFGNIGGKVFPAATTAALNMSTMLGQDLQSSIIQVGKALNDPIAGMTALSRVGVSFSASEKETIKTMQASGNMAGAQAVIMSELTKQFGGAAVAAGTTFGGQMARLNVVMDQAKEKIGLALIPILQKLLTAVMPLITWMGEHLPDAMAKVTAFINGNISPALARLTANFQTDILPALMKVATFVQANVLPALIAFGNFIQSNVLPVLMKLAGFILANVVPTLAQLAVWFEQKIVPILKTLWSIIQTDVIPALETIWKTISTNLIPALQKLWDKLSPVLIPVLHTVGDTLRNVVGPALNIVIDIIGHLIDFLATAIGKIGDFLGLLGNIKDAVGNALGGAGNALHNAHIPGFAVGGVMAQSGLAMVGEHGPEVVALPQGARVYPNGTGPSTGTTYNITMNGTNLGIQDLQRELWRQQVLHG